MADLFDDLTSSDWKTRRQAVEALARAGDERVTARLIDLVRFHHEDLNGLSGAMQALEHAEKLPVDMLIATTRDPDPQVRMYAVIILGELPHLKDRSLGALLAALEDPDDNVRFNAIEALGKLRDGAAVEPLLRILTGSHYFMHYAVITALGKIGDGRAAETLDRFLQDDFLAEPAAEALALIGAPETARSLARWYLLSQGASLARLAPISAPPEAGPAFLEEARAEILASASPDKRIEIARAALALDGTEGQHAPRSLAVILGWLYGEDPLQPEAGRALAALAYHPAARSEAVLALKATPEAASALLRAAVDREEPALAVELARSLDPRGPAPAAALIEALQSDDPLMASAAAEILGGAETDDIAAALFAVLDEAAPQVLRAAAASLARIEQAAAQAGRAALASRIRNEALRLLDAETPGLREAALRILAAVQHPRSGEAVLACLDDPSLAVQETAVELLPSVADHAEAMAAIEPLLGHANPSLRACATRALAGIPGGESLGLLLRLMVDPDPRVRINAIQSIARRASPEAFQPVLNILDDPYPPVRIAALQALQALSPALTPEQTDQARAVLTRLNAGSPADLNAAVEAALLRLPPDR